ncbi:protein of unknown function [Microbacterium sp. Nx66]|nr:protein of unknown function [Microbacterium sp. Nx66]
MIPQAPGTDAGTDVGTEKVPDTVR